MCSLQVLSCTQLFDILESTPVAASSSTAECFLCESPVDIKLEPCGHVILCSTCAQRAKKCPQCKVRLYYHQPKSSSLIIIYVYHRLQ